MLWFAELGVAGIHLHAVVAPDLYSDEQSDKMGHMPASHNVVHFQKHHLGTWRQYRPPVQNSAHYYGQMIPVLWLT